MTTTSAIVALVFCITFIVMDDLGLLEVEKKS